MKKERTPPLTVKMRSWIVNSFGDGESMKHIAMDLARAYEISFTKTFALVERAIREELDKVPHEVH